MTASLFVSGTPAVWVGRLLRHGPGEPAVPVAATIHAVAKPAVDGLESSVCGLLVTASAGDDWPNVRNAPRCEECSRIAG
jgi:hypothetical protein